MTVYHPRMTSGAITWRGEDYPIATDGSIDCPADVEGDLADHLAQTYDAPINDILPEQTDTNVTPTNADAAMPDLTREELYERAQEEDISGRSSMSKEELANALEEA